MISTRPTQADSNVETLQEILHTASLGTLGHLDQDDSAVVQLESTMEGLIVQTDALFDATLQTLEVVGNDLMDTVVLLAETRMELDVTQDALANLIGNIDYDDALDHATADLMDCFSASGAAEVSSDGDLVFDERIGFSKSDLKPMLREAIVRWVELKMAQ